MRGHVSRPRVALIGISGYGRIHLQLARACRDRGEVDLVAAAVINAEEEKLEITELRSRGCAIFERYEEMLSAHAGQIDLCLIPTGIHWHARMTLAALRAGANVLVEKPLAGSVAETDEIQRVEAASGLFVAVGFQDFYDPATRWLEDELRRGAIGTVRAVRFLGIWPRPRAYFQRNNWAGRLLVDGIAVRDSPLNNAFAHFVLLSLRFAGVTCAEEVSVTSAELLRCHAIESFDTAVVTLRSTGGVKVWIGVSHTSREALEPDIVIEGSAGTASWRYENVTTITDQAGYEWSRPLLDQHVARTVMMAAALRRIPDSATPICTTAVAAVHTSLIERLHRSFSIVAVPPASIGWIGPDGPASAVPEVEDLVPALKRAFAGQSLLRESGLNSKSGKMYH